MTFEVPFTRATLRHSSSARSPESCGLMRYQSRLVEIVREASHLVLRPWS